MKRIIPVIISLILFSHLLTAQSNFSVEWQSPSDRYFAGFGSWERNNSVPEINLTNADKSMQYIYDGATRQLKYSYATPDSAYIYDNTLVPGSHMSPIDVNNDGINDLIFLKTGSREGMNGYVKIVNGANGQTLWQTSAASMSYSAYTFDIDNDGFVELMIIACNLNTFRSSLTILSTSSQVFGIEPNSENATKYKLEQNYPNPFNPSTTIEYSISKEADVKLVIYDIIGREVGTFVNETKKQGNYVFKLDGNNLASGTYFYQLIVDGNSDAKKMILVK